MAIFFEKIVQRIVQPDRTGHERVLQRKSVCFTILMHGPIFTQFFYFLFQFIQINALLKLIMSANFIRVRKSTGLLI